MSKKVYIAGKIGDLPVEEFTANFAEARAEVLAMGFVPVCPTQLPHNHERTWLAYMREDITSLLQCEGLFAQRNWHSSKGARIEVAIAWMLGIEIFYQLPIVEPRKPVLLTIMRSVRHNLLKKNHE